MAQAQRDPVCGMIVRPAEGLSLAHGGRSFEFCSRLCLRTFVAEPGRYGGDLPSPAPDADPRARRIAYFSMEMALEPRMPTYSGGLGVLGADALRSCADLRLPVVGVTLLHVKGYFDQKLDEWGNQRELAVPWEAAAFARLLDGASHVRIEGRSVAVRAWRYESHGATGWSVPVILLDARADENAPEDRELTSHLYGGDDRYRLAQEVVLGIGGIRTLRRLGYTGIERFHMNEGHASLLALELLRESTGGPGHSWDFEAVRRQCVFTTHTPVPAGHDQFPYDLVNHVIGPTIPDEYLRMLGGAERLNLTLFAVNLSQYVNGVAKKHGEVSQAMFPGHLVDSITNGVHSRSWTCPSFAALFDRRIAGWAGDPFLLRHALGLPRHEIWRAHVAAKEELMAAVQRRAGVSLDVGALTIGYARRATLYKRPCLVFHEPEKLKRIAQSAGPLQIVFAGKAHPRDEPGKELIRRIFQHARNLKDHLRIVYLENYDTELARMLTSGVDLWLNTPRPPLEASGTSGMKATHNGVPSLSVRDGWWIEGHVEGLTGWSIGDYGLGAGQGDPSDDHDAKELYRKLATIIAPLYFGERDRWIDVMRHAIALNASFFNTHRMVQQYAVSAYL